MITKIDKEYFVCIMFMGDTTQANPNFDDKTI